MAEVYLGAEREFDLEISEEDCESMNTVNDLVEFLARNFYTK
jgi:acyl carrier protein